MISIIEMSLEFRPKFVLLIVTIVFFLFIYLFIYLIDNAFVLFVSQLYSFRLMYRFSSIYIIDRSIQLLVCAGGIIGVQFLLSKAPTFKSLQTSDNHYATRCMLQ